MSDTEIRRLVDAFDADRREFVATIASVPPRVLVTGPSALRQVRNRVQSLPAGAAIAVCGAFARDVIVRIAELLGDASEDPTLDQLSDAVDTAVEQLGIDLVRLALASAADRDFPAAPHCIALLDGDERFALPTLPGAPDGSLTGSDESQASPELDAAILERRRARKEAEKAQRRARRPAEPPRYRRAVKEPPPAPAPAPRPEPSRRRGDDVPTYRHVPVVMHTPHVDYDHALVTRVVTVPIPFFTDDGAGKVRPSVVIAASGRYRLIVRPIYSDGGSKSRTWKSVPVHDLDSAGLDNASVIATNEVRVLRSDVRAVIGQLAPEDWNQL